MKKFVFNLKKVLEFKNQSLENKKNEHAMALMLLVKKEEKIALIRKRYNYINSEFNNKKMSGITVLEASEYNSFLYSLEREIQAETEQLKELKINEDKKRKEVIGMKIETSTLEKLKEKKYEQYLKEAGKTEELFIEEFISRKRITN